MKRSRKAILDRPGNDAEQAFAHGYKTISKGIREHVTYSKKTHHNYKDYRAGKLAAKRAEE